MLPSACCWLASGNCCIHATAPVRSDDAHARATVEMALLRAWPVGNDAICAAAVRGSELAQVFRMLRCALFLSLSGKPCDHVQAACGSVWAHCIAIVVL